MVSLKGADGRVYATIDGGRLVLAEGGAGYLSRVGRLHLPQMKALTELPSGLSVRRLDVSGCPNLIRLPARLQVRHLNLADCTALAELPSGLACYEINLSGTKVRTLPSSTVTVN